MTLLSTATAVLVAQLEFRTVHLARAGGIGEKVNDDVLRAVSCALKHLQLTGVTSLSVICSCQPQRISFPNVAGSCSQPLPYAPTAEINGGESDYPESPLLWSSPFTGPWIAIREWITALFWALCWSRRAPSKRMSLCVDASAVCMCPCAFFGGHRWDEWLSRVEWLVFYIFIYILYMCIRIIRHCGLFWSRSDDRCSYEADISINPKPEAIDHKGHEDFHSPGQTWLASHAKLIERNLSTGHSTACVLYIITLHTHTRKVNTK